MPVFVVERFLPSLTADDVTAQARRERQVAGWRHIRTTYVPTDELCFVVVEAASLAEVVAANDREAIRYERISEAIEVTDDAVAVAPERAS